MLEYIEKILNQFKSCFSRQSAFQWFVVIIVGLMTRSDTLGTTSIIRDLALNPKLYETMNHFFSASSWNLVSIKLKWFGVVRSMAPLYKEEGYTILIGDGVKQAKEGKYMPGVKKLHQESENNSKPEYIFGHMFGGIGVRNASGDATLHLITKAKKSCTAYEQPPEKKHGRGRPPKKGETVKLKNLFISKSNEFLETTVLLYGKEEVVRYYCTNLLWGQKLYQELRFVLVEYQGTQSILVSTDLELDPIAIIRLYSYRFKIECTFRELKQCIGGFSYQFWSKSMPKLKRYLKKDEKAPIESISNPKDQEKITQTVKAIEGYVMFSCIAIGVLQMIYLAFSKEIQSKPFRFLRTPSKAIVSEASVMCYLRQNIFRIMAKKPHLSIIQFIIDKQEKPDIIKKSQVS